jgi:hypothetical protein
MTDEEIRFILTSIQTRVDGLPLIGAAIEVLQRDVRALRDDHRVTAAIMQRNDHSMIDLLNELQAIHKWMIGINDRVLKLERRD